MDGLTLKRLLVVGISQFLGLVITFLLIGPGFDLLAAVTQIPAIHSVSPAEYGTIYFIVTSIPIGIVIMIWMDPLLDTRILPD